MDLDYYNKIKLKDTYKTFIYYTLLNKSSKEIDFHKYNEKCT